MELLAAAGQTFAHMYAAAPVPALLVDSALRIRRANAAFFRLSGCDEARIVSAGLAEFLDGPREELMRSPARGSAFSLCRQGGGQLRVEPVSLPLHDARGAFCGAFVLLPGAEASPGSGAASAVSGQSMPETCDFLLKIIEASYDGIIIADMNDVCLHVNSSLERITGYGRDFFIGRRFSDYFEVENWTHEFSEDKLARVNKTGHMSYEATLRRRDGSVVYLEQGVSLVQDNEGTCIATVWIVRDITEKKLAARKLEQAYEYRKSFFDNVTHEFRTPLTLCIGPLEDLLQDSCGRLKPPVRQQLQTVLENSRLLLMMVNHLLNFSKLQSGTLAVVCRPVDVRAMIEVTLGVFKDACARNAVVLDCSIPAGLPRLHTDPVHLRGILHDLCACALTAASGASVLGVTAAQAAPGMLQDDGGRDRPGLVICLQAGSQGAIEQGRRVLDRLGSGEDDEGDTADFTTGIRLLHARGLAGALGGRLVREDAGQEGVRFLLYVPLHSPATQPELDDAGQSAPEQEAPPGMFEEAAHAVPDRAPPDRRGDDVAGQALVMIVEDNRALRAYIRSIIQRDYNAVAVSDGREALQQLQTCAPDLILSDIMMPGMDGYELLRAVKASEQLRVIPFVFLSARADVEMKIAGLEEGADDYIIKPFNAQELMARIKALLRLRGLMMKNAEQARQIRSMSSRLQEKYRYGAIIGKSAPMRRIYHLLDSISDSEATVLVTGETGTGKELVANAIHYNSRRSAGPLISVNCGAIPAELMEREFFGHVKGAYTGAIESRRGYFAEASGGTLFLDEIGEMSRDMQVKLLRVLERGEVTRVGDPIPRAVDVRLIAATNKDLRAEIRAGRFREDLYYRLYVLPVHIPPLRERREDIPLLIDHFCEKLREKMGIAVPPVSEQDFSFFSTYDYPGNVRELENLVERYCLLGGPLQDLAAVQPTSGQSGGSGPDAGLDETLACAEPLKHVQNRAAHELIMHTLRLCGNNYAEAARKLGISRSSLYRKINEFEGGQ